MSKNQIAIATHAAAADRADLGTYEGAAGWLEVARLLHADSRGGKAIAEALGRAHGTYQRAERLGRFVESGAVALPARPADKSGKEYDAWVKEMTIARQRLHGACMKDGVTVAKLVGLNKRLAGQGLAPSALLEHLTNLQTQEEPTADAAVARIAKMIAAAAEEFDLDIDTVADKARAAAHEVGQS